MDNLLSIDIDGIDYWLWKAINIIHPRIVVLEFNNLHDIHRSVTVPFKSTVRSIQDSPLRQQCLAAIKNLPWEEV